MDGRLCKHDTMKWLFFCCTDGQRSEIRANKKNVGKMIQVTVGGKWYLL